MPAAAALQQWCARIELLFSIPSQPRSRFNHIPIPYPVQYLIHIFPDIYLHINSYSSSYCQQ